MSDIPIYPIEDAEGNPAAIQVYENGVFHNNGNPVGCVTEEDAIAQKFDTTASFAKGSYCMQNHKMQKFKAAKSAGAWDASKVDQTTVGNELTQLNSTLARKMKGSTYSNTIGAHVNVQVDLSSITAGFLIVSNVGATSTGGERPMSFAIYTLSKSTTNLIQYAKVVDVNTSDSGYGFSVSFNTSTNVATITNNNYGSVITYSLISP